MSEKKKTESKTRQNFLHTFFLNKEGYQEIEVNGFWLINQLGDNGSWNVAIFTKEGFENRKKFLNIHNEKLL